MNFLKQKSSRVTFFYTKVLEACISHTVAARSHITWLLQPLLFTLSQLQHTDLHSDTKHTQLFSSQESCTQTPHCMELTSLISLPIVLILKTYLKSHFIREKLMTSLNSVSFLHLLIAPCTIPSQCLPEVQYYICSYNFF